MRVLKCIDATHKLVQASTDDPAGGIGVHTLVIPRYVCEGPSAGSGVVGVMDTPRRFGREGVERESRDWALRRFLVDFASFFSMHQCIHVARKMDAGLMHPPVKETAPKTICMTSYDRRRESVFVPPGVGLDPSVAGGACQIQTPRGTSPLFFPPTSPFSLVSLFELPSVRLTLHDPPHTPPTPRRPRTRTYRAQS